jgi:hypothetical protein
MTKPRQKRRLADMSIPADQRGRPEESTPKTSQAKPAQMDHATNPRAARNRRDGERKQGTPPGIEEIAP